jgi:TATA-box binding protein (TBP) (component of TFIID and TFIIIB)
MEYNPEQFPGTVFRLSKPNTATLFFRTDEMVRTGSKSRSKIIPRNHFSDDAKNSSLTQTRS